MFVHQARKNMTRLFKLISASSVAVLVACFMSVTSPEALAAKPKATEQMETVAIVNINLASAEELAEALSGVGVKKAEAIVAYRTSNGKFNTAEDIVNVKGIGQSILDNNRKLISL